MTRLAEVFGCVNNSTCGYCATGNSAIESFWSYFDICVHKLNDEEYANVKNHLQHIVWAWNTTIHATTGLWPFEIYAGTSPVTLADALILSPLTMSNINIHDIRVSAAAYAKAACEHADYMRAHRAET